MQVHPDGLFLNSIPKSGTVLLNNILMRFVDRSVKIMRPWLDPGKISHEAFSDLKGKFFVGHLPFSLRAWEKIRACKQVLLIRHPRDVCLSTARFYASESPFRFSEFVREARPSMDVVARLVLTGWKFGQGPGIPPASVTWKSIAQWADLPNVKTVTFEELQYQLGRLGDGEARDYFAGILEHGGIDIEDFPDWRERVAAGANPEVSQTYSGKRDYLAAMEGFPSAQDLAWIDFEYRELTEFYERRFLRPEFACRPSWSGNP